MKHCTKEQLIAFERRIADRWEAGELPYLLHLSGGNEEQLIKIFEEIKPGDWIFSGHRSHYHYLLAGGSPKELERMIGGGDSMFIFGKPELNKETRKAGGLECNFLTSSILAGLCGAAAGVAWDIARRPKDETQVWCFIGDGAEDEGHFYEAVRFVHGQYLPCTFIIEDNDRSVDTNKRDRRGPSPTVGTPYLNWPPCVWQYPYQATYPHAGSGCKHHIQFKTKPH